MTYFSMSCNFCCKLTKAKIFVFQQSKSTKDSSQLAVTIKYFHVVYFEYFEKKKKKKKKKIVPQNTGPLNCEYLQQNKCKYTEIWYEES